MKTKIYIRRRSALPDNAAPFYKIMGMLRRSSQMECTVQPLFLVNNEQGYIEFPQCITNTYSFPTATFARNTHTAFLRPGYTTLTCEIRDLGPVVRKSVSANPGRTKS